MSKICCGVTYSDEDKVCRVCGKSLENDEEKTVLINTTPDFVKADEGEPSDSTEELKGTAGPVKPQETEGEKVEKQDAELTSRDEGKPEEAVSTEEPAKAEDDDEPSTSILTADMMGPIKHPENEGNGQNSNMAKPMGPQGQPMMGQPIGPQGQPMMGQPMGPQGQPMMGQPMGPQGQPMMGQPMGPQGQPMMGQPNRPMGPQGQPMMGQQPPKPPKPPKSPEAKEKAAKICGITSLSVSIAGLVAVLVLLFMFVINPGYKKFEGEAEKGFHEPNTNISTVSDATEGEEE